MSDGSTSTPLLRDLYASTMGWINEHPELSNAVMTALLWGLGDVIAQLLERRRARKQTHLPLSQSPRHVSLNAADSYGGPPGTAWRFDWLRLLRLASFAGLIFAPATKAWFEQLEAWFPGSGLLVAVQRMATDQLLYSALVISSLFLWTGLWESGGSLLFAIAKIRANLWPALCANWMVWPAVQLVLQSVIPLHLRMLVAALVNIPWTAYLATKAGAKVPTPVLEHQLSKQ